jgi:hypothetical protein
MPTAEEMAAAGFAPEDYETDPVELWPENQPAFDLFCMVQTQWRIGMNGATGLDYSPLFVLMDKRGLSGDAWQQLFDDVRVIESAALVEMNKRT